MSPWSDNATKKFIADDENGLQFFIESMVGPELNYVNKRQCMKGLFPKCICYECRRQIYQAGKNMYDTSSLYVDHHSGQTYFDELMQKAVSSLVEIRRKEIIQQQRFQKHQGAIVPKSYKRTHL